MKIDRNELITDRVHAAYDDAVDLVAKIAVLLNMGIEAGPEMESRVRDIESHLYYAAHSCESIRRYCTKGDPTEYASGSGGANK